MFRADCSWPNTAVAAITSVPIPTAVATIPDRVLLALLNIACTAAALSGQISSASSPKRAPSAASLPKATPATPITMISIGASENTV